MPDKTFVVVMLMLSASFADCGQLSEADVPIEVISKAMGHSSVAITANRYIKRTEQRAVNAMSVVNF